MRIPVLRLDRILLTALHADFTDELIATLQQDILALVNSRKAEGVVIDISAMDMVDSYAIRQLSDTVRMVRLLGGEVALSGMQPMVAMTLMEMDLSLTGVRTAVNLEQAVAWVKDRLGPRDTTDDVHEG